MDLVFFSNKKVSDQKIAQTELVRDTAKWRLLESKG